MNWILDMALRNIRRNKRRTVLAVASIALSVMLMTFMGGFVGGVLENMVRNITKNATGHVRITSLGFEERERFLPVDELIENPSNVIAAISAIPELDGRVMVSTERLLFGTLLSNGNRTKAAFAFSGDCGTEAELLGLKKSVVDGRYLTGSGETIIGAKLAEDLGLKIGDSLRVVTQGADSGLRLKRFGIVGIFRSGLNQLDREAFQIPVADAKEFLRTDGGVQQIVVMLKDYREAEEASRLIGVAVQALPGSQELSVKPWRQIGEYGGLIGMMEIMYGYIYIVVAFLGAFIITNILMMVVLERRREIGILKALGFRRNKVMGLFLAEGAVMGIMGSAIGAVLGLLLCGVFSVYGFDFSSGMGSLSFPVDPIFYTKFDVLSALKMFVIGVAVSIIVSILPSRRAATMDAVEAMKSVA